MVNKPKSQSDRSREAKDIFIKTADRLFFQRGYENVSVDEICKAAGKAKGLFFYYFDKKENVVKLLFEMQVERMGKTLRRRLAKDTGSAEKVNTIMQALFFGEKSGPRAMYYFKTRPMPGWADSFAHHLQDKYILPIIKDTVAQGVTLGEFQESDSLQVEIIYLGISQFMHRHYENMADAGYAKSAISAIQRVLESALGCNEGEIQIMKEP